MQFILLNIKPTNVLLYSVLLYSFLDSQEILRYIQYHKHKCPPLIKFRANWIITLLPILKISLLFGSIYAALYFIYYRKLW